MKVLPILIVLAGTTDQYDFSLSVLNRHYVLHGMDAGNFYRPQDVHRLILGRVLINAQPKC